MKNIYWISLVLLIIISFTPFREDIRICRVYDSDYKRYELWEEPMIVGLESFSSEELANLPFSIIGNTENACYTHKWYQSLDGLNLIDVPVNSYSLVDKILNTLQR